MRWSSLDWFSVCYLYQICKQVRLLITELCQCYRISLPEEMHAIDNYLSSKVSEMC